MPTVRLCSRSFAFRRSSESDPGAPRSRTTRARSRHPAPAGQAEAPPRGGCEHRGGPDGARSKIGQVQIFPDLVLTSTDRGHKLMGTVEVETAESVNHLEAMAQWAHLGRARAPFHLYVPAGSVDIARRLAAENQVNVAEIWSYHTIGDQTRFTLVHRSAADTRARPRSPRRSARAPAPPARAASRARSRGRWSTSSEQHVKKRPVAAAPPATAPRPREPARRSKRAAAPCVVRRAPQRPQARRAGKASLAKSSATQKRK